MDCLIETVWFNATSRHLTSTRFPIIKGKHTGCIKKMSDSDFSLKSVPVVGFYFLRGVLELDFRAQTTWALKLYPLYLKKN